MNTHQYKCEREGPTFSSTLLDVIYQSIDERQDKRQSIDNVARRTCIRENECNDVQVNEKLDSKFVKTKSKAMKIYGYLKQGNKPISPGGRLTSFLASLFSNEKAKKYSKSTISCTCRHVEVIIPLNMKPKSKSSTSAFSRNKTTPCGVRKTVRFNIINECSEVINNHNNVKHDDDDDDDMSCSSSDLFELDNLSDIGIDTLCMQELPLYETTNVDVNRAIAHGLIV
ncbi:BIG GRAIN 1-like protein A [Tanacetum coccineum]|uniref:BIG GRAIN 1-like protein A n=1 Tax=Tanacetum coccineum TaxID=301880 RepID=A0ABQ5H4W6_9ASTR